MIARLRCFLFGHKYIVERLFNPVSRKIGCTRCGQSWGMNDTVRAVVPWDEELEQMYRIIGQWPGVDPKEKEKEKNT